MSEGEQAKGPEAETSAASAGANPWLFTIFGASTLLSLAFILTGLVMLFGDQRLSNLRPYTLELTAQILQALEDQYVPRANIEESPLEEQQDHNALWTHRFIRAKLPPHLNLEGLKQLIERRMSDLNVEVVERPVAGHGPSLSMLLGPYEFATVELVPAPLTDAAQIDIQEAAYRLGQDMPRYLESAGVAKELVQVGTPEDREDSRALWTQTRVDVALPDRITVGELRARLQELLTIQGVEVVAPTGMPQALQFQLKGLPVVSLFTALGPAGAQAAMPKPVQVDTMELSDALGDGGSMEAPPLEGEAPLEPVLPEDGEEMPEADPPMEPLAVAAAAPEYAMDSTPVSTEGGFMREGVAAPPPRLAIILDDGGNVWARSEEVLALDNRLTLSILPHTSFAVKTAEAALARGFEVMLHMPMETFSKTEDPGPGKITVDMDEGEIRKRTEAALESFPGIRGVNNHTGSLFTADRLKMQEFLTVIKEKGLFFVDSRTHATSQAYDVAQEMGILSAKRDVFLDNERSRDAILTQLEELIGTAKSQGQAIGIGHFYQETAAVLVDVVPRLEEMGIQLVHVSELVH